jgi:pyruvate dehydrogenase E1 component
MSSLRCLVLDKPTVILAKTVKGYGMGEAGEGQNTTHSQKKLNRYLGDNSIVFENFTASIGDLMVANIRLLATRLEESVNGYLLLMVSMPLLK